MEKYKELYQLSKEVFYEELSRSARIDDKASRYFTVLTFLLGAFAFYGKYILQSALPPENYIEWSLLIISGLLLFLLFFAWIKIFSVFKIHSYAKIPIAIDFFDDNELVNIYYAMAKGIKVHTAMNREKGDAKSTKLYHGYIVIRLIVVCLIVLSVLFAAHSWSNNNNNKNKKTGGMVMSKEGNSDSSQGQEGQGQEKPTAQNPDPDVKPPKFDLVTESYDPSKVKAKQTKVDVPPTEKKEKE